MKPRTFPPLAPLVVTLALAITACSKSDSKTPSAFAVPSTIELESVSAGGCLNAAETSSRLQAMNPEMPVLEVATDFNLRSDHFIRAKFRRLLAYTNFRIDRRPLADYYELKNLQQGGCDSVSVPAADGSAQEYKIVESSTDHIRATHSDGRGLELRWLGPQRIKLVTQYFAFDLPCTRGHPVLVTHGRVLDWTQAPFTEMEIAGSPLSPNKDFLQFAAEATGKNITDYVATDESGTPRLTYAKAQELMHAPPVPELLECDFDAVHSPTPPPPEIELFTESVASS